MAEEESNNMLLWFLFELMLAFSPIIIVYFILSTNLLTYKLAFTAWTTLRNVCRRAKLFLRMPGVVLANVVAIHSRTSSLTSSE